MLGGSSASSSTTKDETGGGRGEPQQEQTTRSRRAGDGAGGDPAGEKDGERMSRKRTRKEMAMKEDHQAGGDKSDEEANNWRGNKKEAATEQQWAALLLASPAAGAPPVAGGGRRVRPAAGGAAASSSQKYGEVVDLSRNRRFPFPWKIHQLLSDVELENDEHVISWLPGGKCFKVHDRDAFVTRILPIYFRQKSFKSFQRQLYLYGFDRMAANGKEKGAYFHPLFMKGHRELTLSIERVTNASMTGDKEEGEEEQETTNAAYRRLGARTRTAGVVVTNAAGTREMGGRGRSATTGIASGTRGIVEPPASTSSTPSFFSTPSFSSSSSPSTLLQTMVQQQGYLYPGGALAGSNLSMISGGLQQQPTSSSSHDPPEGDYQQHQQLRHQQNNVSSSAAVILEGGRLLAGGQQQDRGGPRLGQHLPSSIATTTAARLLGAHHQTVPSQHQHQEQLALRHTFQWSLPGGRPRGHREQEALPTTAAANLFDHRGHQQQQHPQNPQLVTRGQVLSLHSPPSMLPPPPGHTYSSMLSSLGYDNNGISFFPPPTAVENTGGLDGGRAASTISENATANARLRGVGRDVRRQDSEEADTTIAGPSPGAAPLGGPKKPENQRGNSPKKKKKTFFLEAGEEEKGNRLPPLAETALTQQARWGLMVAGVQRYDDQNLQQRGYPDSSSFSFGVPPPTSPHAPSAGGSTNNRDESVANTPFPSSLLPSSLISDLRQSSNLGQHQQQQQQGVMNRTGIEAGGVWWPGVASTTTSSSPPQRPSTNLADSSTAEAFLSDQYQERQQEHPTNAPGGSVSSPQDDDWLSTIERFFSPNQQR